ncbi:MAG: beta-galactosidase trimerization domain-containing protein [Chloroflexi bacterium]|nr:beta-galactosidase trimerization domain-containing protein [Chloroflexota bacterium]
MFDAPASGSRSGEAAGTWWRLPFGMFQTNLREIDATLDVEAVLDYIQQHGADAWLVNAGGILSFYPTDLPFQTRNPYLAQRPGGDMLGDAVRGAHARGLRLVARMDFSKVSARIAAEHPEWLYVSPSGQSQVYNGLFSVCPSGQYYQEKTFQALDEVIDRYPVDGFFFNWFGFNEVDYSKVYNGVCHCLSCQSAFKVYSGLDALPDSPAAHSYGVWRTFAAATIHDLTNRLKDHIAARRPDAFLLGRTANLIFHEANNALGRELWPHATSESVSAPKAHRPEVPVLVNAVAFMDMPYRLAGEQPEQFAQYLAQTISRGGNPSTYIMGPPGLIPYPCLPVAGEITRFHKRWRDVYLNMRPTARTGLVLPKQLTRSAVDHERSTAEYRGFYEALQQTHVPFDVVPQDGIVDMAASGGLARYSVLILPDLGELAAPTARTLDAFVADGGRLLSSGSSGLAADGSIQLASLAAESQLAVTQGQALWSTCIAPDQEGRSGPHQYLGPILPVYGAYHFCAWKDDAERHQVMLARASFGPPEKAYGYEPVEHPGYVVRAHGKGRTAMLPWTIGRSYRDLGLTVARDVMHEIVQELLAGDEVVSVDLPEHVELTIHRSGERLIVHLVNMSGARRTNFGPPLPVRGGQLRVRGAGANAAVHALVSDAPCQTTQDGDWLSIALPEIDLFDVIVVNSSAS